MAKYRSISVCYIFSVEISRVFTDTDDVGEMISAGGFHGKGQKITEHRPQESHCSA